MRRQSKLLRKSLITHVKYLIFIKIWAKCLKKFYKKIEKILRLRKNSGKFCKNDK